MIGIKNTMASSLDPWCLSRFSNVVCGHSYSDETQLLLNILDTNLIALKGGQEYIQWQSTELIVITTS
jgi:hypothetical protein